MNDIQLRETVIQLVEGMKQLKERQDSMEKTHEKRMDSIEHNVAILMKIAWVLLGAVAVSNIPAVAQLFQGLK